MTIGERAPLPRSRPSMMRRRIGIAILLAGVVAVGLILLPAAVFWLGSALAGDYAGDGGAWGLIGKILADAMRGSLTAWSLVLTPYLVVQFLRLSRACFRPRKTVTGFTDT